MAVESVEYTVSGIRFVGALVFNDTVTQSRPLLLMSPNWLGPTEAAIDRARRLAGDEYVAFVVDMYGEGKTATGPEDAAPLANAVRADAPERRRRISAALDAFSAECVRRGIGDPSRKAAVGFCFGGGNVLELARTGADLQAVVCFHGDLTSPLPAGPGTIAAPLLVLHGSADPVSPKAERDAFEAEMTVAGARWQMLTFGGAVHSFAEEEADIPGIAEYDPSAARQSYELTARFIADALNDKL